MSLRGKQKLFAMAYVGEAKFNATKAAKIAGYRAKDDNVYAIIGHRLLRNVKVREEVDALAEKAFKDAGFTDKRVIKQIIEISYAEIPDFMDKKGRLFIDQKTQPTSAIKEVKTDAAGNITEFKLYDKKWAIELLSNLLKMKSGESNEIVIHLHINNGESES